MSLNPVSAKAEVDDYFNKSEEDKCRQYPQFFTGLSLQVFRHIRSLDIRFIHPITVISGSNKCGKTSALMAIACSHYNFQRRNVSNGCWERATWSKLMRFTLNDTQTEDWEYTITYREGRVNRSANGYRRCATKKWGGAAKKEGQIGKPNPSHPNGGREATLIDLNRITPSRHLSVSYYNKAKGATPIDIEHKNELQEYLSYILEKDYSIQKLTQAADGNIYKFTTTSSYSSFNTASGEDVLTAILLDVLKTPDNSLIMIDEVEVGLHPKIQRRLMDVLYIISQETHKQFIISTHSYAIINSVPPCARIYIDNSTSTSRVLTGIETYEILTRMDSETFPVSTIYVEDEESKFIVQKAISEVNISNPGFSRLLRVIPVGSADITYRYFMLRNQLREAEKITTKAACILDGDMNGKRDKNGDVLYPEDSRLFFHFSNEAPEKMLLRKYLSDNPNETLQYHLEYSNPHCLMQTMVDEGIAMNTKDALEKCFNSYRNSSDGGSHFEELKRFVESITSI